MRLGFMLSALCLSFTLVTASALALPAPKSEQELLDESDLVARARVLSVTCTSVIQDDRTGEDLPGYLARLQVLETKKGDAKTGDEVLVTWRVTPKGLVGRWAVYYYPGEEMWTHLVKRSGGASYASTWWNAKGDDLKNPDTRDLPTTPGETVLATPDEQPRTPL